MPELPDVEGFRRYLARHAQGRRIARVEVLDAELVRNRSAQALGRAVHGARFAAPRRHGKWLIAPVGDVEVLMHFGMTGPLRDDRAATCPRCGTRLRRGTIAGRTACWCGRCQRGAR
jgi:formamidopyrimidine-DNA glycosylase